MMNKNILIFASFLLLSSCSSDEESAQPFTPKPMQIGSVEYGSWLRPETRASLDDGAVVYVSAGGAAPTEYKNNGGKWQVATGSPQEWTSSSMPIYGFLRDDDVASITTPYQIPLTQDTNTTCSFLASNNEHQAYNAESSGSISIAMTQRLAKLEVTVSDAVVGTTQLDVGGGNLYCRGMFNYDSNTDGSWNLSIANPTTITVTECNADKVFTVYILPQDAPASGSRFFAVSSSANHVAYYALPSDFKKFEARHVYSCTLVQDMTVASIQVDTGFNNGTETVDTTTGN